MAANGGRSDCQFPGSIDTARDHPAFAKVINYQENFPNLIFTISLSLQ
jgi:hypothetical protein